ncbi:MAG: helix-turn-helix domain-containing protein [Clostridia bacterium]|nr:helix-turn-helix domain-containing protein [Clostridia bacterium]
MDNEKFGKFIKELRKQKNMTQKELAEKLNITDKAISKWERGLSFPDITILNSLAEIFDITVSELLNAEIGKKEELDIEKAIQEAVEKVTHKKEIREKRIRKIKKSIGIISLISFICFSIMQLGYMFLLKKRDYEYAIDILYYIVNEIILFSGIIASILAIQKSKLNKKAVSNIVLLVVFGILTVINFAFMSNNGFDNECIVSFSKNLENKVVLKKDKETGSTVLYRDTKLFLFAKPKEQLEYEIEGEIKTQWLTNDICSITYKDKENITREFVSTYGDRGNGISYYYVTTAIYGNWQLSTQYGNSTQLLADSKGITITKDGKSTLFKYEECKQFGTIAIVLYNNEIPRYIIALNEDCEIDEKTGIIKKGGTITLCEVSMEKTKSESLYCTTYKNANDLSDYNLVDMKANDYTIKNGILYISYDGKNIIEVPGDFSNTESSYNDDNYQISEEKTIFFYTSKGKRYLVYSNDMGKNWETIEISNKSTIQSIQFLNSDIGFMLEFEDVAMGNAYGKISKTTDGGKNWQAICYGIGDNEDKYFKRNTKVEFIDEKIGYLIMPSTGGEKSELYETKDGGQTYSKVTVIESDIYDYYNLPTQENGKLYLKISQGSKGDYNGGDSKTYCSNDNGNTWNEEEI